MGIKIEGVKKLRSTDKSGKVEKKWGFGGDCKNLKQNLLLLFENLMRKQWNCH
tara:strand:+ start:681 stop:839 length:159 start_codon:yes stop_codon:yes gene_type:complete